MEITELHYLVPKCACGKEFKDHDSANAHIMDEIEARLRKEMEG